MKLKDVISRVDGMKPNAFSPEVKTGWVNELENMVQTEIFLLAPEEMVEYTWEANAESELLIKAPYSKLYWIYLSAMIDFTHGEYDKYSQTMQMFNAWLQEYQIWYARTFRPADGGAVRMGYYLSAYGLAKLHGFEGTEEDWLESLVGPQGAPFTYEDFTAEQLEALRGPQGETLVSLERTEGDGSPGTVDTYTVTSNTGKTWNLQVRNGPVGPRGPQGAAFTYDDFTEEQLAALKGRPFTYEDFTEAQLEALRGPAGETITDISRTSGTGAPGTVDTYTVTTSKGNTWPLYLYNGKDGGVNIPGGAEVGQTIKVSAVDENGKPTAWEAVDMPKGEVTADSLSLTINPTDGKIYITVNGVMVGQGVTAGPPASFGDVQVDNLILKLNNGQSVTFNVKLSEPPTNPQVVTILSDSEHITFDKSKLTFTAENYDTYQTVTASAKNVTEDGTANIIIRNSDELMTDSFITVYLKAEFYNVDTTIPTEGQHIVTMDDFESSSPIGNYIRLYHYIGEYDNIVIPAELDGKIPQICPGNDAGGTTTFWSSGTALKYVTFADGVVIRGAGSTSGGSASSLFTGFTSLIGVSNMNPNVTDLANAFSGCTALKFIDNLHELTNVTYLREAFTESGIEYLPDLSGMTAVTNMDSWVKNCTALKRVYGMPVPATSCNTNQLFNGCSALEKAEVPQNATTMFYCFNGCTSLREVTVHATGITTGTYAFNNCTNLTVYLDADTTTYETLTGLYGGSTNVTFITDGGASAPSIVVWGDSTSSPGRTWKEWPARLQEVVSDYLVKNQAASGEFTTSTSARQGGNALSVGAFTIPADTIAVGITLKSADGHTFGTSPVFSAAHSFNPCTISGVKGTITHAGGGVYNFTRLTAGEAVDVTEGAVITSDADDLLNNADAVMLVNIGINAGWDEDEDVLLEQVQSMVDHFTAKGGTKYIITGPYAGVYLTTDEYRQTVFSYETKAATAFGEHWLNLREYLIENGLTENNLTATATDTERMALGQIPGSLLGGGSTTDILMYPDTSSDQTHPNAYGQNSIFNAFYAKGVALGYWT